MAYDHGEIHWTELMTRDLEAAREFYAEVAGWSYQTMPMSDGSGDYHVAMVGERMVAGLMDITGMPGMDEVPAHWFTYIAVRDVDAAAKATAANGGTVVRPVFEVPGVGRIAVVQDPGGAAVGLMTPAEG